MTDKFELSRRKTLAGLATIGAAGVGAGLGTSAYFSDEETFEGNEMVAGELDLKVGWQQIYYGGVAGNAVRPRDSQDGQFINANPDHDGDGQQSLQGANWNDGGPTGSQEDVTDLVNCGNVTENYAEHYGENQESLVALDDVKPGDGGQITFNLCLCDNPGYVWLTLSNVSEDGGTNPEPEQEAEGDADNDANLAEYMDVYVALDENCNSRFNSEDTTVWSGTFADARDLVQQGSNGLLLADECFEGGTCHCINVGWEVPTSVGNVIQGDSIAFDLGFYTEQCRHNPEPTFPGGSSA